MVSKQVLGWHVAATMPEELVTTALQRPFLAQSPTSELVVHFDRGGQYCGNVYRTLLHQHGAVRSQSCCGDCYNNAQAVNRLKVLDAGDPALKPRSSNVGNGPFLSIYLTLKPAPPAILTTIITNAYTPASVTSSHTWFINSHFKLLP